LGQGNCLKIGLSRNIVKSTPWWGESCVRPDKLVLGVFISSGDLKIDRQTLIVPTLQRRTQCRDAPASRVTAKGCRPEAKAELISNQAMMHRMLEHPGQMRFAVRLNGTLERPGDSVPRWSVGTIYDKILAIVQHLDFFDSNFEMPTEPLPAF